MQTNLNSQLAPLLKVLQRLEQALLQASPDNEPLLIHTATQSSNWSEVATCITDWAFTWQSHPEKNWALYFTDTGTFLSSLIGAWLAGKNIYLPSNSLPHSIALIKPYVAGFVGEFDSDLTAFKQATPRSTNLKTWDVNDVDLASIRTVFLTSGSSGNAKLISKSLSQLCAEVSTLGENFQRHLNHSVTYATVSHQHFYGFIFRFLWPLLEQRAIATETVRFPEDLITLSERSPDPLTLISSPAFLSRLTERDDWHKLEDRLGIVFSAGGVLADEHHTRIQFLWDQLPFEIYGSTEHGAIAYRHQKITNGHLTTLQHVTMSVAQNETLLIRSPYMDNEDLSEGWAVTSDKAKYLNERQFQLKGRTDRVIKVEEKRISLTQMEQTMAQHRWIKDIHIVPITTTRLILGAVIVLNAEGTQALLSQGRIAVIQSLKQHLSVGFEHLAIPRRWRFVSELPINSQGKLESHLLKDLLNTPAEITLPISTNPQVSFNEAILDLGVPADLLYFKGHFTTQPIVAGVVLIDWAIHYTKKYFPITGVFKAIKQLKFHQTVSPNQQIQLKLVYFPGSFSVKFVYSLSDNNISSGVICWSMLDV